MKGLWQGSITWETVNALGRWALIAAFLNVSVIAVVADPLDVWHARQSPTAEVSLRSVAFANGLFVAVGDSGTILTSPDGVNWTQQQSGTLDDLRGIANGNGLFVAIGGAPTILTSPDA